MTFALFTYQFRRECDIESSTCCKFTVGRELIPSNYAINITWLFNLVMQSLYLHCGYLNILIINTWLAEPENFLRNSILVSMLAQIIYVFAIKEDFIIKSEFCFICFQKEMVHSLLGLIFLLNIIFLLRC